ncbi:MAG: hypothetical protein P8171_06070 [Candidatus Thiodiazotropha sp.]|jgi:predicted hotdog family 3-hydroxylacyl-ACP dehydratase
MKLSGPDLYQLLPHTGTMCLLQEVLDWDAQQIVCRTATHRNPTHPLRTPAGLASIHAAEYGAQAMALHGGLQARAEGKTNPGGYLVSLRGVKLHRGRLDDLDEPLTVEAHQLLADAGNMLYDFTVKTDTTVIAEGRAAVIVESGETS